ncbi:collagenase-like [Ostrinia furnacalis]|uniref:collagenase-like n=1 Tax=Ostrinia furnacalis TaxID=93504 RepID=UPI0010405984|nr:collagenase-like [Ostrinia furnacalis]
MKWSWLVFVAAAAVVGANPIEGPQWYYHDAVGIPLSARLMELEKQVNYTRIVGGTASNLGAHPFMVGIVSHFAGTSATSVCGASLLSNTRSLTAAHCWFDGWRWAQRFTMVFGSQRLHFGGIRIDTSDIVMHPSWNVNNYQNDIAIVRHNWVTFTNIISPINLPTGQQNNNFAGTWAMAMGFGMTSDFTPPAQNQELRQANLQVITNAQCLPRWPNIVASSLCTTAPVGVNVCVGDSGGPLVVGSGNSRIQIGVVSFGAHSCEAGQFSVFARVTSYLSWILSTA